jgi:hypothetical protein
MQHIKVANILQKCGVKMAKNLKKHQFEKGKYHFFRQKVVSAFLLFSVLTVPTCPVIKMSFSTCHYIVL